MSTSYLPQIEHVVHLMLENRSLDNVLGWLYADQGNTPARNIPAPTTGNPTYDGLYEGIDFTNPLVWEFGTKHEDFPITKVQDSQGLNVPDLDPHEVFEHVNVQVFETKTPASGANPTMRGFLQDFYDRADSGLWSWEKTLQIMQSYTPGQLPVLNGLAKAFAVSDRWFASIPTQTNANRAFSLCGTSQGYVDNQNFTPFTCDTIFNVLTAAGKTDWAIYYHDMWPAFDSQHLPETIPYTQFQFSAIDKIPSVGEHMHKMDDFHTAARAGALPSFSYLEPAWYWSIFGNGNSYHPPADLAPGEQFLSQVYASLTADPKAWQKTLLIVTFDEHGGTLDRVPPPTAVRPDATVGTSGFTFDRLGVRVPTILASPWIDERTVFRSGMPHEYDHTSVLATLLRWYGLDPTTGVLGARTAVAPTFEDVLSRTTPRTDIPVIQPGPAALAATEQFDVPLSGLQEDLIPLLATNLVGPDGTEADAKRVAMDMAQKSTLRELKDYIAASLH